MARRRTAEDLINNSGNGQTNGSAHGEGAGRSEASLINSVLSDPMCFRYGNELPTAAQWKDFITNLDGIAGAFTQSRADLFAQLLNVGHRVDEECGYPPIEELTPYFYRSLYDRDPVAARVVQMMPKETWQGTPSVYEEERGDQATKFEQAWDNLSNDMSAATKSWHADEQGSPIWEHLLRADILSGIGQFGVILLGLDDGKNLQDPVDGVDVIANTRIAGRIVREVVPDCPPSPEEITAATKEIRVTTWENNEHREVAKVSVGPLPPDHCTWNRDTQACVQTAHGNLIINRQTGELVRNEQPALAVNQATFNRWWSYEQKKAVRNAKSQKHAQKGDTRAAGEIPAATENKVTPDVDPYLGRSAGYPGSGPFIQGTDRQYSQGFGLGMPAPIGEVAPSLSGTDQQYFGVQFGPSEAFSKKPAKQKRKLLFLRCFDESLVQIVRYEWNVRNPRFGLPVMYRITLNDPRQPHSGVGLPLATVYVHWSRVIHIADSLHNSEIFGYPRLKQVLPAVLDDRKIAGASAEGYWQSCFVALSLETHPQLGGDVIVDQAAMRQMMHDFKNRLQRYLSLSGMSAKTLPPQVIDPTPFHNMQIERICTMLGVPVRVWKGSERGELASSQDDEAWNERKRERQNNYITPKIVCPFIDRLVQIGVLPEPGNGKDPTDNGHFIYLRDASRRVPITKLTRNRAGEVVRRIAGVKVTLGVMVCNQDKDEDDDEDSDTGEKFVETGGYHVEWPDVDALGKKDKAGIALQNVQTMMQYVSGNVQTILPEHEFYTKIMGWSDEEAEAVLEELEAQQEQDQQDAQDLADEHGYVPKPPEGFQNDPSQFGQDDEEDESPGAEKAEDEEGEEKNAEEDNPVETSDKEE